MLCCLLNKNRDNSIVTNTETKFVSAKRDLMHIFLGFQFLFGILEVVSYALTLGVSVMAL